MEFSEQYVVYLALGFVTVAISAGISRYVYRYRSGTSRSLIWLLAIASAWVLFNALELIASTAATTLFWAKVSYLFIAFTPVAWYVFTVQYTGRRRWLQRVRLGLILVIPALTTLLAWTNDWHRLLWQEYMFVPVNRMLAMHVVHGPWFWVHAVYSYLLVLIGVSLIMRQAFKSYTLYRRQSIWLVMGGLVPILFSLVYVLHLVPNLRKDFTPVGFAVAGVLFAIGMFRNRLFDLKPVARDLLIESLNDPMLVLDCKGRLVDLNPAAQRVLNQPADAVIGQPAETVLHPWKHLVDQFRHQFEARIEVTIHQDDAKLDYDLSMTPLHHGMGNYSGRLILLRDISERKQTERALNQRTAELEVRNRELDAFAHTVAHDLKSPLTTIVGYADLLRMSIDDPELAEMAEAITQSGQKMYNIIEGLMLLSMARQQEITPEPLNMGKIVVEALGQLEPTVKASQAVVTMPSDWPMVLGYAPWVEAVWVNYLSNAIKYGGTPPQIEVGADAVQGLNGNRPCVRFWVCDNGAGIPPEQQAQLFTLFNRLGQSRVHGHGLGLTIVQRIITRLGGDVGVESQEGQGSTFWFTLPAVSDLMSPVAPQKTIPVHSETIPT